jgi:hypothetical protein
LYFEAQDVQRARLLNAAPWESTIRTLPARFACRPRAAALRSPSIMRSRVAAFSRVCVAGLLICCLASCQKPPDFHIHVVAPSMGASQYKLTVDGVEMGPFSGGDDYDFTTHGHRAKSPADMLPHIEASVLYVCGWQPATVELPPPSDDDIQQARDQKQSVSQPMSIQFDSAQQNVTIYVDNHGGPAAQLAVGEISQPVAANAADSFTFPYYPRCDEAKQVLLNGQTIGTLTEDSQSPGEPLDLLLDPTAKHCFRFEWHKYSIIPDSFFPDQVGGQTIFKPQLLRTLTDDQYVDYFLQPLPNEVESQTDETSESALNEISCR